MVSLIAYLYLLFRKGNAFAADVTSPVRVRHWAAAFFGVLSLGHAWWFLFYVYSGNIDSVGCMVITVLDCVGLFITLPGTLLSMLQDRKRPFWPFALGSIPYAVLLGLYSANLDSSFLNLVIAYFLLLYVAFVIYMVSAVRQYGRWLRDNYADLEHKEVWQSFIVIIASSVLVVI